MILAELVKFEHTIFALPFAFIGLLIGSAGRPDFKTVLLVLAAMVGARTAAMGFNRLIDASIDAKNPRTQKRALPAGLISKTGVAALIFISLAVFFASAFAINEVCFKLSPLAVFLLLFYSYTKRFTSLSHFALGLTLAVSPSAGYLAANTVLTLAPLVLSAAVLTWVAGFDIIYACQDIDFDKKEKLYSLPAVAGLARSLTKESDCVTKPGCGFDTKQTCPRNSYNAGANRKKCTTCPGRRITLNEGSTSANDCGELCHGPIGCFHQATLGRALCNCGVLLLPKSCIVQVCKQFKSHTLCLVHCLHAMQCALLGPTWRLPTAPASSVPWAPGVTALARGTSVETA